MTEKRFILTERKCYFTSLIFDNQKNEKMGSDKAMECLNALHEENQHLRELLDIGKTNAKAIIDVLNEQEQYKILTNSLKEQNQKLKLRLKDLGVEYY